MNKIFLSCIFLFLSAGGFSADLESGKNIFTSRCSSCHSVNDKVVGPALKDVDKRREDKWIVNFVQSSQSLIKKGDEVAVKVFNENNKIVMPDHPDLKEADIANIISYIKDESAKALSVVITNRPKENQPNYKPLRFLDIEIWSVYSLSVLLISSVLFVIVAAKSALNG